MHQLISRFYLHTFRAVAGRLLSPISIYKTIKMMQMFPVQLQSSLSFITS